MSAARLTVLLGDGAGIVIVTEYVEYRLVGSFSVSAIGLVTSQPLLVHTK
jgi:hypothetical protein